MSARCKVCKRHRCGRCGWTGRRKVGVSGDCARCGGHVTTHAVMHRPGTMCSLEDSAKKHKRHECRWCGRVRRDDRMRRWDGQMECREVHACGRAQKERRKTDA